MAACRRADAPQSLINLRLAWSRDSALRLLDNTTSADDANNGGEAGGGEGEGEGGGRVDGQFVRQLLADSVQSWSPSELREYLARAGVRPGGMARSEMTRAVVAHIAPEGAVTSNASESAVAD